LRTPANESGPFVCDDEATDTITLYFDSNRPDGPGPYTDDVVHNGSDIDASVLQVDQTFGQASLVQELSTEWADRKVRS
jgi:hypothetical protein